MTTITLSMSERLLTRLRAKADEQSVSVEQVALNLLETYAPEEAATDTDFLLAFAQMAEAEGWQSETGDISVRSREILQENFPEYLIERTRRDANNG
jgi:hypothetical protein